MQYQAYIFDFDYTLADSSPGIVLCFRHVLDRAGFSSVTDEAIKQTIGLHLEAAFSQLTGEADPARLAAFKAAYLARAEQVMTANTRLYPEAVPLLSRLKAAGRATGIVSTKLGFRVAEALERYGAAPLVDHIVGGDQVSAPKPDPEGLLWLLQTLALPKSQALYVGDSLVDCHTAKNAGVDFAAVTTGATPAAAFSALGCPRVFATLAEIP